MLPAVTNMIAGISTSDAAVPDMPSQENFFDAILTSDDVEKTKPNPTAFKKILKKFKATSKNVIVIDDDKSGIIAAKKCNIQSLTFNPQKKN